MIVFIASYLLGVLTPIVILCFARIEQVPYGAHRVRSHRASGNRDRYRMVFD